jgi:Domain of unknown function (DUF4112)
VQLLLTILSTGVVPGAGDVVNVTLDYVFIIRKAREAEIPSWLLRQILKNSAISGLVGLIPFAGDVFVGTFKASSRNAILLEEFFRIREEEGRKIVQPQGEAPGVMAKVIGKGEASGEHAVGRQQLITR